MFRNQHRSVCNTCSLLHDCGQLKTALRKKMEYIETFKNEDSSVLVEQNKVIIGLLQKLVKEDNT